MSSHAHHPTEPKTLSDFILKETEVPVHKCYQCGKCSAGCPLNSEMEYPPSVILRMLQYNTPEMEEKVLRSYAIWVCLTCEMCYQRCPMEIDIPQMMDYLRSESIRRGLVHEKAKSIVAFHNSFLSSIKSTGRLHELGVVGGYKFKTMNLMQDVELAPKMMARGKFHIFAEKIKDLTIMKRIFKKTVEKE